MGCGKSSVGRLVAARLGLPFFDLDERVVADAGAAVSRIFSLEGEPAFRARERAALIALAPELSAGAVIATGGGTTSDPDLGAWMSKRGTLIWLDARLEEIDNRVVSDGSRPLFGDRAARERLYEDRRPGYERSHHRIDTTGRTLDEVVQLVATVVLVPPEK